MGSKSNLEPPRPSGWEESELFKFIEDCWCNTIATFANQKIICNQLSFIDAIFGDLTSDLKPAKIENLTPALLFIRSHSLFRSSVMIATALPADSYPLQRGCLEAAGYAHLVAEKMENTYIWIKREDDKEATRKAKQLFTHANVRNSIARKDGRAAEVYHELYERTITLGAHPNGRAALTNILKESLDTDTIKMATLPGPGLAQDFALRTCAQVGICALKAFGQIFADKFKQVDASLRIEIVAQHF